jgi:hypothetical protein
LEDGMSATGIPSTAGLISRVQNILLKPAAEWEVIAGESATTQGLFTGYACILALLPLIGTLIARVLVGGLLGGGLGLMAALTGGVVLAILGYLLNLALVFAVGLIINALAASFDAKSDAIQAMKVSVYAGTALWVAGIVSWIPVLGWLIALAALGYTCYLLFLGVKEVMQPPADKAMVYTIVIIAAQVLLYLVIAWITIIVSAMAFMGAAATGAAALGAAHY